MPTFTQTCHSKNLPLCIMTDTVYRKILTADISRIRLQHVPPPNSTHFIINNNHSTLAVDNLPLPVDNLPLPVSGAWFKFHTVYLEKQVTNYTRPAMKGCVQ